jgi:hypothetical protein
MKHLILFESFDYDKMQKEISATIDHQQLNSILNIARDEGIDVNFEWTLDAEFIFSIYFNRTVENEEDLDVLEYMPDDIEDRNLFLGSSDTSLCDMETFHKTMSNVNNRLGGLTDYPYYVYAVSWVNEHELKYEQNINFETWLDVIIKNSDSTEEIYALEFHFSKYENNDEN